MAKYRIMAFDGGGIRGALTAGLLKRLDDIFPGLIKNTHFFAGTSTGSFIALGLAAGVTPGRLAELYSEKNGEYIFSPRYLELFRPKYDNGNLKELLCSIFSCELKLKDLEKKVLIPSFRVTGPLNWSAVFFNNFPNSDTLEEKVIDVALSSSAAPVYFPSYRGYIDGGVAANNPSTAAIALAGDVLAGNQKLDRIYLLSLGTGFCPLKIDADTTGWGALEWALYTKPPLPLLSLMFDGLVEVDAKFSSQLLGPRYYRVNPLLPKPIPLDDYQGIAELKSLAGDMDISPLVHWIENNWFD
ncbi:patatin-like protein [Desulfocucumis palustris]|uniref:Patatin-like protein n=1 Tax=Desulfocucumis palustris TaxID=1898651 RepID=A0A2L2XDP2_9FIRM|nr:patatin-like phospholipase family protein [Desulfocucumis palustris]GBF34467.1 patatin-like protein [Desulfocucumis palustris]